MTRDKALAAMDRLVAMGYHVTLGERDLPNHVFIGDDGEMTSRQRWLEVSEISMDKVDLCALVEVADELGFDVGFSPLQSGKISFTDMPTDAEQARQAVVSGRRNHPR